MQQHTSPLKQTTSNKISQLYGQFTALRGIIDSHKKLKKSIGDSAASRKSFKEKQKSTHQKRRKTHNLLQTPQPHVKAQSQQEEQKDNSQRKQLYEDKQDKLFTRQQLIQEYSQYYDYSIKKVMKQRERSGKKCNEKIQIEDQNEKAIQKAISKRLLFDQQKIENQTNAHQQMKDVSGNTQLLPWELNIPKQTLVHNNSMVDENYPTINSVDEMFNKFQLKLCDTLENYTNRLSNVNNYLATIKSYQNSKQ